MNRLAWGLAALSVGVAGCGQGGTTGTSRSVQTSSSASAPAAAQAALFAVLEARHCKAPEPAACESASNAVHDTVAIAGLDGYAKAKATFIPRSCPDLSSP